MQLHLLKQLRYARALLLCLLTRLLSLLTQPLSCWSDRPSTGSEREERAEAEAQLARGAGASALRISLVSGKPK